MKLNKQQIDALANEIISQISAQAKPTLNKEKAAYEKAKKSLEDKLEKEPLIRGLRMVSDEIINAKYNALQTIGHIKAHKLKEITYTPSIVIPKLSEVQSKIILKTIECDNLDEIINSIKSSYIK